MKRRIALRRCQTAFHPNATQYTLHLGTEIFAFWRRSARRDQSVFALNNVTDCSRPVALDELNLIESEPWFELLNGIALTDLRGILTLPPYGNAWLTNVVGKPSTESEYC